MVVVRLLGAERGTLLALAVGALPLSLLPAYPLLALALLRRRRWLAVVAAAVVGAHLALIAPALTVAPRPAGTETAPRLRVVVANLYVQNPTPEAAGRELLALRPDVLVVPELDAGGLAGLRAAGVLDALPHKVVELGSRTETVGLFSRLPLRDVSTRAAGGRRLPRATVEVDGTPVRLLAAHPLPPISGYERAWRASLRDLAREAADLRTPAVMAGDFNADRDHALLRSVLEAGMHDSHDDFGRGLARTWPSAVPLLQLDHVLLHDDAGVRLVAREVREVRLAGSDHRAVVADLSVVPADG